MPPINCTSKWRICTARQPASRTTAKASGRISSSASFSACLDFVRVGNAFEPGCDTRPEFGRLGLQLFI